MYPQCSFGVNYISLMVTLLSDMEEDLYRYSSLYINSTVQFKVGTKLVKCSVCQDWLCFIHTSCYKISKVEICKDLVFIFNILQPVSAVCHLVYTSHQTSLIQALYNATISAVAMQPYSNTAFASGEQLNACNV